MSHTKLVLFLLLACLHVSASAENNEADAKSRIVHQFLAAFNAHDSARMGELVTEDVKWLSVANGTASAEVEGRRDLVAAMDDYFKSCPSCRSAISNLLPSRDRLSAVEVATWQTKDGLRSQQSLSIYEFSGARISAVYYFPAESVPPPSSAAEVRR